MKLSFLKTFNNIIIIGTTLGTIKIFDYWFRIVCWFDSEITSPIKYIDFDQEITTFFKENDPLFEYIEKEFIFPNFIILNEQSTLY